MTALGWFLLGGASVVAAEFALACVLVLLAACGVLRRLGELAAQARAKAAAPKPQPTHIHVDVTRTGSTAASALADGFGRVSLAGGCTVAGGCSCGRKVTGDGWTHTWHGCWRGTRTWES